MNDITPPKTHRSKKSSKDVIEHLKSIGYGIRELGVSKNNLEEYQVLFKGQLFYNVMVDPDAYTIILRLQLSPYHPSISGSLEFYNSLNFVNGSTVITKWFHQINTSPNTPATLVVQALIQGYEKNSFAIQEELFRNEFGEHLLKFKNWQVTNGN